MSMNHKPPGFADWLLQVFCRQEYKEEVQGDLQEIFDWRVGKKGLGIARLRYIFDALSAIRFYKPISEDRSSSGAMFLSFIKSSFRNFRRHWSYTLLNVFGLTIGMAGALFILEYVSDELNYNASSEADQIYRVSNDYYRYDKMVYESSMTFSGVGPAMERDLPEVTDFARLYSASLGWGGAMILTRPDKPAIKFKEQQLYFSDPDYLGFFDIKVTHGSNDLDQLNTVLLTAELAEKYFGNVEYALGKTLRYNDNIIGYDLQVTGIFQKPDFNLQVDVDALISYSTRAQSDPERFSNDWGGNAFITFIKTTEGTDSELTERAMDDLTLRYKPGYGEKNDEGEYNRVNRYFLTPVKDIHLHSDLQNEVGPIGDASSVNILQMIALFIVIIAWINFINLTTAKSVERAREVGVRKVMGASRKELVAQFFTEAILMNLIAAALAIVVVILGQSLFDSFVERDMSLRDIDLIRFGFIGASVFVVGTVLSGIYPAVVISSHKTITALKGKPKGTSGQLFRRTLIVFQLVFSSLLIIATLAINSQLNFMTHQQMGFNMDQVLILRGPVVREARGEEDLPNIELFKQQVKSLPGVKNIGTTTVIPGEGILRGIVLTRQRGGESDVKSIERVVISNDFLSTLEVNFIAGTDFNTEMDGYAPIILNESAVEMMGFDDPNEAIGQNIYEFGSEERRIVGVIEDYHHESLNRSIDPMYFVRNGGFDTFYAIRMNTTEVAATLGRIESSFTNAYPGNPADYYFLDEFFGKQYKKDEVNSKVFSAFALMAIMVACLGLYGLSAFAAMQRTKEVGVRKVLGASIPNLFLLLFREVFLLVLIGFLIALPLGYFGIDSWLSNFAYRMEIGVLMFLLPLLAVLTITLLATAQQIIKVAIMNPVRSLRYE